VDLREALDIDSMDFLNVVVALHQAPKVDIAERDCPNLYTQRGAIQHLSSLVE
jgi:acyl carrier protein